MSAALLTAGDLSLGGTGYAIALILPDAAPKISVFTVKAPPRRKEHGREVEVPMPERHSVILGPLYAHLDAYREIPRVFVKEQRLAPARGRETAAAATAQDLAGLHAVCEYGLHRRGVRYAGVASEGGTGVPGPTLKAFATGRHQASKEDVRVAAAKRLEGIHVCTDNNQSDALWLLVMMCLHYGWPMVDLPVAQQIKADKILWPEVAGLDLKGVAHGQHLFDLSKG